MHIPILLNGKKYDKCVLFNEDDFVYPVFRCPTQNITTKINGINSYPEIGLTEGLCPLDPMDPNSPLDPNASCGPLERRPVFSQCKNNCPGGKYQALIVLNNVE